MKHAVLLSLLLAIALPAGAAPAGDPPAFDRDHVLEVRITLDPRDWEALRHEHRDLLASLGPARLERPAPNPYRTYPAEVTLAGETIRGIGLRKRGFIGSSSFQRPSLGLVLNHTEAAARWRGLDRLSLNNNLQDPSQLHQVLTYALFAKAGVPAPRCSLAHVTVNGTSLGIYSHVEPVRAGFLRRQFGSAAGALYEGQLSDFRPGWVKTFEPKEGTPPDRGDLEEVVRALQRNDADLVEAVGACVDVEAYLSFWAMETLLGLWDSYSNNGNNFFVFCPADRQRFVFIPWGTDAAFGDRDPFTSFVPPESVLARCQLPNRLYRFPSTRDRYRERLRQLLRTVWSEKELLAEVDRWRALIRDRVHVGAEEFKEAHGRLRTFIRDRRAQLEAELNGPPPEWNYPLRSGPCLERIGRVTAEFSVPRQSGWPLNPLTNGTVTLMLEREGSQPEWAATGVVAAPATDARHAGCLAVTILALPRGSLKLQLLPLVIQPDCYATNRTLPVDGFSVTSALLEGPILGRDFKLGAIPLGTLRLNAAGPAPGDTVSGLLRAELHRMPP